MPKYEIDGPDGKTYEIDGPAGATREQIIERVKVGIGQDASPQQAAPRWDVVGDIGRAAGDSAAAFSDDVSSAFPNPATMDLGPVATVKRMGSALKAPLDALGVALSPVTGAVRGTLGSALSYAIPTTPDGDKYGLQSDPKRAADEIVDTSLMMFGPRGMGTPTGPAASLASRRSAFDARTKAKTENRARAKVSERLAADDVTPEAWAAAQREAAQTGDPVTLMDIGGPNVKGLAGAVHRAPGPARTQMDEFFKKRDLVSADSLTRKVHNDVGRGSSYRHSQELFQARSAAAKEPYRAALEADSVAPFETQYRQAVIDANSRKAQIGKQIAKIEREQSGALAARGAAGKPVRDKYMQLREEFDAADVERTAWDTRWKQAQTDRTSGAPGAVWSPRLQQFIDHPEVQAGLRNGLKLEKQDAITEGRTYKDADFSITGYDEAGEPLLGQVPTMKSLAVAKEGLDARIAELKHPNGRPTKAGVSLKRFRDQFVAELDRLNPRYKAARDAWSGPSQTLDVIEDGKTHFSRAESNDQILDEFNALSESDKDFYRAAAAEAKIDQLERAPDASDKSKRIINNERDRKRFRMLFKTDADADKFIASVERQRRMFETKGDITGNSKTAGRLIEDAESGAPPALEIARGGAQAVGGNLLGAASSLWRAKRDLGLRNNPEMNSEIARILMDTAIPASNQGGLLGPVPVPKAGRPGLLPAITETIAASRPEQRPKR